MLENEQDISNILTNNPEEIADAMDVNFPYTNESLSSIWSEWESTPPNKIEWWRQRHVLTIIKNINDYENLGFEVAKMLAKYWETDFIIDNLSKFKPLDNKLQILLIEAWKKKDVAEKAQLFKITANETAHNLINFWSKEEGMWCIFTYINNFNGLDNQIAHSLLKCKEFRYNVKEVKYIKEETVEKTVNDWWKLDLIRRYISHFDWLDEDIAKSFVKRDWARVVAENLDQFTGLSTKFYEKLAKELIEKWRLEILLSNLEKYEWINQKKLIKKILNLWIENLTILMKNIWHLNNEWYEYLSKIINSKHYAKDEEIRDSREDIDNDLIEKWYEELNKIVINELKNKLNIKNPSIKIIDNWLEYIKLKINNKIPLTINHNQWKINKIIINDLDIEFSWIEETIEAIKIIDECLSIDTHTIYQDDIWFQVEQIYSYDLAFQYTVKEQRYYTIRKNSDLENYPTLSDKKTCKIISKYINKLETSNHQSRL